MTTRTYMSLVGATALSSTLFALAPAVAQDTLEDDQIFVQGARRAYQGNFLVNDDRPEATAVGFFSIPAGEAESSGLEFDANLDFANDFSLWASYAYVDAEFSNSFADADGFGFTINPGDPLINSPAHQLNVQASQRFDVGTMDAQVGGGVLYVGERNGFVGSDFVLPEYTTVRLFGELNVTEDLAVRVDIDNLFDETFYTNSFANVWVEPGAPRRFRLTATYGF